MCPFAPAASGHSPGLAGCPHAPRSSSSSGCPFALAAGGDDTSSGDSSTSSGDSSTCSSTCSSSGVHQAWKLRRPVLSAAPMLTRRALRRLGRTWSLAEVKQHRYVDDGWIAVDGSVYDITEHIAHHPGWASGCRISEVLSIIAHLGTDCSAEFQELHRPWPAAYRQLQAFYIGPLSDA